MANLADFLLARIAEDDKAARDASGRSADWDVQFRGPYGWGDPQPDTFVLSGGKPIFEVDTEYAGLNEVEHVLTWSPARVLAECEAKQRIVEEAMQATEEHKRAVRAAQVVATPARALRQGLDQGWFGALRLLALPYAKHEDYREEWRP